MWLSKKQFRRRFGLAEAIGYLHQIRGTLAGEARDRRSPGCFYTGLRHAFAEIDGLGKHYKGEYGKGNTAANAVAFGSNYLGRVNVAYKDIFGLIFYMYRHGLAHGHLVRTARYRKDGAWHRVYWVITQSRKDHLALHTCGHDTWIVIWAPQLVDDTIAAIDLFIQDLKQRGHKSKLVARFKKGYEGACTSLREPFPPGVNQKNVKPKTEAKKLRLNAYSREGIAGIRALRS